MRRQLLYCLVTFLTLCLFSNTLYAQDLSETFTLGGVSVDYPTDWFAREKDDTIYIQTIDEDVTELGDNVPPETIVVSIATPTLVNSMGLDTDQTGNPIVALENFLTFVDDAGEAENVSVGGYEAARAEVGDVIAEGTNAVFYVVNVDGTLLLAAIVYGSEYSSEPQIASDILASVTVDTSAMVVQPTEAPDETNTPAVLGDPDIPLVYGDTVGGEITNRQPQQVWTFSGAEGDVVTITMIATADDYSLDTRLYLYTLEDFDDNGEPLAQNDDASNPEIEGLNSQIEVFELPDDGEYIIVATRLGDGVGEYTLTLEEGGISRAERAQGATPIAYGDTVTGELSAEEGVQLYTFEGTAGDIITITMIADDTDDLDPRIALYAFDDYAANSYPTMSNDDAFENDDLGLNSQIFEFELYLDATYIIEATYFRGEGGYTLTLESDSASSGGGDGGGEPATASEPQPIAYGEVVSGDINDDTDPQFWLFSGSEGDVVTITMIADDDEFDTRLYLYHAEDTPISMNAIAENDDMEESETLTYNSQIFEFELPDDGDYVIEATRFGSSEGSYTLTLEANGETASGGWGRGELSPVGSDGGDADGEIRQWASDADGSSQYGTDAWGFVQATGEPNVDVCSDDTRAWASETATGEDYLILYYDEAVIPTEINIYQSYTPGSIIRVEVANSETEDVFEIENSADPGDSPCPGVLTVTIEGAETPVDTVIIYLDQSIGGSWNEIDAVELVGTAE